MARQFNNDVLKLQILAATDLAKYKAFFLQLAEGVGRAHGGSQNALLCQLTADATGRPVVAGPVEATAIGNILVQARALGLISGGLDELRASVRESEPLQRFEPAGLDA